MDGKACASGERLAGRAEGLRFAVSLLREIDLVEDVANLLTAVADEEEAAAEERDRTEPFHTSRGANAHRLE